MGIFTDMSYLNVENTVDNVDYTILIDKLYANGFYFPFMSGGTPFNISALTETDRLTLRFIDNDESDYYYFGNNRISGNTDSKIDEVKSYNNTNRFIPGFEILKETYLNYIDDVIDGVSTVVSVGEPSIYAFDALTGITIGTINQNNGIFYEDFTGKTRNVTIDDTKQTVPVTNFNFKGEGRNKTNVSLSALTKEEYLFGIISIPEVKNDVFIDRGVVSPIEMHLRLSEIKNIEQLTRYGNGMYKLRRE